jgi:hypothetical protein
MWFRRRLVAMMLWACLASGAFGAWPWTRRKADFPEAPRVDRIEVTTRGVSGVAKDHAPIQEREAIETVLGLLHRYRDGWKKDLITPAAGDVSLSFISIQPVAVWPLSTVRLGNGWISTHIDGLSHTREMPVKDQRALLNAIGIDPAVLDQRTGQPSKSMVRASQSNASEVP